MSIRTTISRFIAILLLVIPGVLATIGFLQMKNAVFHYIADNGNSTIVSPTFQWLPFSIGLLLFAIGVSFIGGWIFFRDKKHNYVAPRFRDKKSRPVRRASARSSTGASQDE